MKLNFRHYNKQQQTVALTLGGGGFKSVADGAGVTAGLLGYLMKHKGIDGDTLTLESSGLYEEVDVITSISGGSWFGALSIHSKKFKRLIDAMAREGARTTHQCFTSRDAIAKLYNDGFTKLFTSLKSLFPPSLRPRVKALEGFLKTDEEDLKGDDFLLGVLNELKSFNKSITNTLLGSISDLRALLRLAYLNGDFLSWVDFVNVVLQDISNDISDDGDGDSLNTVLNPKDFKPVDATLGSTDVNEWAKGKTWAILTSIIYPKTDKPKIIWHKGAYLTKSNKNDDDNNIFPRKNDNLQFTRYINYSIEESAGSTPELIPARFSTVVGTKGEKAPLPFATEKYLKDVKIQYKRRNPKDYFKYFDETETSVGLMPKLTDSGNFDDTPLLGAAAASSAFAGGFLTQSIPEVLNLETNVWFSPKRGGKEAFDKPGEVARKLWKGEEGTNSLSWRAKDSEPTEETLKTIQDLGLYELYDGGFTDPFGISTALAAGATHIFTINTTAQARGLSPGNEFNTEVTLHFIDGNNGEKTLGVPPQISPLFKEKIGDFDKDLTNETQFFKLPKFHKNQLLTELSFVSLKLTTLKNDYFGIEEDRMVHLYVVEPKAENLSIGNDENFKNYGEYVQQIVETMTSPDNATIVKDMMKALTKSNNQPC